MLNKGLFTSNKQDYETDTKLFHLLYNDCYTSIIFLKGRLKFNTNNSAPFPSMIIIHNENNYIEHLYYEKQLRRLLKTYNYL